MPRRHILIHQGEPRREIFLIVSGSAKVTRIGPAGNEVILRLKGPGDFMGGLGLAQTALSDSGVQSIEPCHMIVWNAKSMDALWERSTILQRNTAAILAQRLDDLEDRFYELATEKVALRLARTLIRLAGCINQRGGEVARINLSREELAQMTGTTLFAVSRLLSEWTQRGILEARREAVLVYDDSRLLALAEEKAAS